MLRAHFVLLSRKLGRAQRAGRKVQISRYRTDGSKYDGTCEITHEGGRSLKFIWHYGKKTSIGLGKLDKDGKISVEYQGAVANREGRAEYDVKSADKLTGTFHRKGTKGKGTEVISREQVSRWYARLGSAREVEVGCTSG